MRTVYLPNGAKKIIERLESQGYRADIVGGCVRDSLLGRVPSDFDITTSATPCEVKAAFSDLRTVDTGIKHGTVTVILDGEPYEVTTYRLDGEYQDNRHPVSVSFASRIEDDLSRRDFTINAMAYSEKYGLTDAFGGVEDINARTVRAVGDANTRFDEDALRILRAIRFAAVLGFGVEDSTARAVHEKYKRLASVSVERIFTEVRKLICAENSYNVISEFSDVLLFVFSELDSLSLPDLRVWRGATFEERLAVLYYINGSADALSDTLSRLRCDNRTADACINILKAIAQIGKAPSEGEIRRFLTQYEDSIAISAARLASLMGNTKPEAYERARSLVLSDAPRRISQLAINGDDIVSLGARGKRVGEILTMLLYAVCDGRVNNDREPLKALASKLI